MNPIDAIGRAIVDALYFIAFIFDGIVYSFIPKLYKLIIYLANVDLFNNNSAVNALMNRAYILVGVFMLFKLAFSIVRYIVDPNAFSDQSRGFTNLVKRLLIALVLLVSVPWLFGKIYEIQGKILSSNIIPNLILGTSNGGDSDIEETAKDVQFLIFGPFYTINPVGSLSVCEPDSKYPLSNIIGTTDMALKSDGKCLENLAKIMDESDDVDVTDVTIDNFFGENRDFSSLGALITLSEENKRVVNYLPVVSTLCGGYLVFLLLSFCIDVGARAIRLLFLQILSPVAIISSVDPSSSSQSDRLKEWGKECLSTFVSLFLRLAVIYLVIQLVKVITAKLFAGAELYNEAFRENADINLNIFVYIFLILGAFQVAKKIPELIEKAFGIKLSGELNLNPFKALSDGLNNPFVGAVAGGVAGGAAGAMAAFTTSINHDKGTLRSIGSGIGGLVSGGVTGFTRGGIAGGTKGWSTGLQSGGRIARRMEVRSATGGIAGFPGMVIDRARDIAGAPTTYESRENKAKRFDSVGESVGKMKDRAVDQLSKKSNAWKAIQARRQFLEQQVKTGAINEKTYVDGLNKAYGDEQELIRQYIDSKGTINGNVDSNKNLIKGSTDAQLEMYRDTTAKSIKDSGITIEDIQKAYSSLDANDKAKLDTKLAASGSKLPTDKDFNMLDAWDVLGADGALVKTIAEQSALSIRADKEHNDAYDRDQAIHGSRLDSHQKR